MEEWYARQEAELERIGHEPEADPAGRILQMAAQEGVELGVGAGRITARGSSPELTQLLKHYERELVEHLAGEGSFRSPIN